MRAHTITVPLSTLLVAALMVAAGCGGRSSGAGSDAGSGTDAAAVDGASGDATGRDGGTTDGAASSDAFPGDARGGDAVVPDGGGDAGPPLPLTRGLAWVREHPMFLSGLTVNMGAPPAPFVNAYFDTFHANAAHLWQTGLPTEMDGWAAAGHPAFRFVSWTLPDGTSQANGELLGGYGANVPGRIGYQVSDEPREMAELLAIGAGVDAVRAADPDALIIVNFSFLADDLTEQLLHYGSAIDGDVVSFDTYTYSNKAYGRYNLFREAGLAQRRPYWRYIASYTDPADPSFPAEADMRWQAMLGMVYGYTGHTWFLYQVRTGPNGDLAPVLFDAPSSFAAATTIQHAYAAQLNVELLNLGRAITQLTSLGVCYTPAVVFLQPGGTPAWSPGAGGDPFITAVTAVGALQDLVIGFFIDDQGERYVILQNPNHPAGDWPIDAAGDATFRIDFDFSSAGPGFDATTVLRLDQLTGQVVPRALTSTGVATARLEVTLPAGDVTLFKYATGDPFALATW